MKKQLRTLFFLMGFVFVVLSFSTNSFAVEDEKSYEVSEIISESDTLYEPEPVAGFDSEKSYEVGEIISESDTLYEPEPTNAVINNTNETNKEITPYNFYTYKDKTITAQYPSISNVPETRYYEEYTGGYWYRGNLKLKSVVASGSGYAATFNETISGGLE